MVAGFAADSSAPCKRRQVLRVQNLGRVGVAMRQIEPLEPAEIDTEALAAALKKRIQGEVRFDNGSRALYSMDASNYRHIPIGVVIPRTIEDVLDTVATSLRSG